MTTSFKVPERYRSISGRMASTHENGNNGMFFIPGTNRQERCPMKVMASDGMGWEHVSVSYQHRCPTWLEMCFIKHLFWGDEARVMQLHPPKSEWVNNHSFCLHLWRPEDVEIPHPPEYMVGIKEVGVLV